MQQLKNMRDKINELEAKLKAQSDANYLLYCAGLDLQAKLEIAIKALIMLRDTPTNNDMALVCAEEARKALEEMGE